MYSLYRAWLSMGPCGNLPGTSLAPLQPASSLALNLTSNPQLTGAPDVNLQVGPTMTNFSAHKNVLSAHSGFFKAAITTITGMGPILVPNINVDEFSHLLTFMYTGYLDLNVSNIYNILLATHILHMPRALEICRNFLMQSQSQSHSQSHLLETRINSTNIIKPIPSKKPVLPHQEIYPPVFSTPLEKHEETPFKKIPASEAAAPVEEKQQVFASTSKEVDVRSPEKKAKSKRRETTDKVIIDIACCDGPVRFHRVINKNYGLTHNQGEQDYNCIEKINRNEVMNKVMTENIKQLTDENQSTGEVFTCLYCNHTFKSQYCYQKHARRHLNPVDNKVASESPAPKREVKLLDMNVQYYPCKTCGSKFPSYYFVHKHRKLCHAEEMADNGNKNNEMVQVKNDAISQNVVVEEATQNSSSRNSIIDVEETDNNE